MGLEKIVPLPQINDLPDELLFKVFSMLPQKVLVKSVQHVCTRWLRVSRDWRLWKHFTYCPDNTIKDSELIKFLEEAPELRHFDPKRGVPVKKVIEAICEHCPNLQQINLNNHYSCSYDHVSKLLNSLKQLEHLGIDIHSVNGVKTIKCICKCPTLKHLKLYGCSSNEGRVNIWKFLGDGLPSLQVLDLVHADIDIVGIKDLTYMIDRKKDQLVSLSIFACMLNEEVFDQITRCTKLEALRIHNFEDDNRNAILSSLKKLTSIKELTLRYFSSGIEDMLLKSSWSNLLKLDLGYYRTSNNHLINIIIKKCPNLIHLKLAASDVTPDGLKDIYKLGNLKHLNVMQSSNMIDDTVKDIIKCPKLVSVNISGCHKLTDVAVDHLLSCRNLTSINLQSCYEIRGENFHLIPSCLPHLRYLNVEYFDGITEDILRKLREDMPDLDIISQYNLNKTRSYDCELGEVDFLLEQFQQGNMLY